MRGPSPSSGQFCVSLGNKEISLINVLFTLQPPVPFLVPCFIIFSPVLRCSNCKHDVGTRYCRSYLFSWQEYPGTLCGNKMPTRCNRLYLLQILLHAQHVSGNTMPIIRSSRVLYRWSLPVVFGALVFRLSVWCGAEGYVSGLQAAAIITTMHGQNHFKSRNMLGSVTNRISGKINLD